MACCTRSQPAMAARASAVTRCGEDASGGEAPAPGDAGEAKGEQPEAGDELETPPVLAISSPPTWPDPPVASPLPGAVVVAAVPPDAVVVAVVPPTQSW